MTKFFVELGSSYFDTLLAELGPDPTWRGITIDARPELLARLPDFSNVEKKNVLITDDTIADGTLVPFYYVPSEIVVQRGFPQWLDGCGSTNRDHTILRLFSDHAVTRTEVSSLSVRSLFKDVGTLEPDLVKIDLEGGDYTIVNAMLDLGVRPKVLIFEVVHMTPDQIETIIQRLGKEGYTAPIREGDSVRVIQSYPQAFPLLRFFTDPTWALGIIHRDIAALFDRRGIATDMIDFRISHPIDAVYRNDAIYMTTPGDAARSLYKYGIKPDQIYLVAHGEVDLHQHIRLFGLESFAKYAGYGVVSDTLAATSIAMQIPRVPKVLRLGVDTNFFASDPAPSLNAIGYATVLERYTAADKRVEIKRGRLARQIAENVGIPFVQIQVEPISPHDALPAFYRSVGAYVLPSLLEGASLPPLEAAAAGRVVIGTPVGQFPRLVSEGIGILGPLEEDAFVAFASAKLREYKADPIAYRAACTAAQEAVRKHRAWDVVIDDWIYFLGLAPKKT
jgi:hypothetical protein